jgi:hypothetical protein
MAAHPFQMNMFDMLPGSFDYTSAPFQSDIDLLQPLVKEVPPHEMQEWRVSNVFPKSLLGVQLQAPTGAIVRRTVLESMKRWLFKLMPLRLDNSLSKVTKVKIYEDTIADRLAVGAPPREVSFREMEYMQSIRRYGLAGSKWDINLMYPEGQAELAMQIKQINEGVFTAISQDAIAQVLRTDDFFKDWAKKSYWPEKNEDQWYAEQQFTWNILPMLPKGVEKLCSNIDFVQAQYQGVSNSLILPVKSAIYCQYKAENYEYWKVGNSTAGFNNKYSSNEPVLSLKGNNVYLLAPFQTSSEQVYDPLLRHNVQIGEHHIIANRAMYQDPHLYSSNDLSIAIYDEDEDDNKRKDMLEAIEQCGFFDLDGYLLPPDYTLGGGSKRGYGSGSTEDLKQDPFSKDSTENPNERVSVRLMGEIGGIDALWFKHFVEVYIQKRIASQYSGGAGKVGQVLAEGEALLRKHAQKPFNLDWLRKFVQLNYSPGNVVLPPADRVFEAPANLRQLENKLGSASYKFPAEDGASGVDDGYFGTANLWTLEELAKSGNSSKSDDVRVAKEYVQLVDLIVRELRNVLPHSDIIDRRLVPLAVRSARESYAFFVNAMWNTTNFVWINVGAKELLGDLFSEVLTGMLTVSSEFQNAHMACARKILEKIPADEGDARNKALRSLDLFLGGLKEIAPTLSVEDLKSRVTVMGTEVTETGESPVVEPAVDETFNDILAALAEAVVLVTVKALEIIKEGHDDFSSLGEEYEFIQFAHLSLTNYGGDKFKSTVAALREQPSRNHPVDILDLFMRTSADFSSRVTELSGEQEKHIIYDAVSKFVAENNAALTAANLRDGMMYRFGFNVGSEDDGTYHRAIASVADISAENLGTYPLAYVPPAERRATPALAKQFEIAKAGVSLLQLFRSTADGDVEEATKRVEILFDEVFKSQKGSKGNGNGYWSVRNVIEWAQKNEQKALQVFFTTGGTLRDLINVLTNIDREYQQGIAKLAAASKAASEYRKKLANVVALVTSGSDITDADPGVGTDSLADGYRAKKDATYVYRESASKYVQTSLTFTPELVSSLVEHYRISGLLNGSGGKAPYVLPSSPYNPDVCGTLEDLLSYHEKIVRARNVKDYPVNIRHLHDSAQCDLGDFFYASRLLSGAADASVVDSVTKRRDADARQFSALGEPGSGVGLQGGDYTLRTARNSRNQYIGNISAHGVNLGGGRMEAQYPRGLTSQAVDGSAMYRPTQYNTDGGYSSVYGSSGSGNGGLNAGALADLGRENLTAQFSEQFRKLSLVGQPVHQLALSRIVLFSAVNKFNFIAMINGNVPLPVEALGLKHLMRYSSYSAVKMADGGRAAYIIFGNPCFTVGNHAVEQSRQHIFTCTGGLIMVDHRNIFVQHNVHIVGRGGGASSKAYDPRKQIDDPAGYYNPAMGKYGYEGESLIWTLVPYGFHRVAPKYIDITGRPHKLKARNIVKADRMRHLDYPTAYRTCCLWSIRGGSAEDLVDLDDCYANGSSFNTECPRGQTYFWDRSVNGFSQKCKIQTLGHWKEEGTYPGVQKARAGFQYEFQPKNTGNSVSFSY